MADDANDSPEARLRVAAAELDRLAAAEADLTRQLHEARQSHQGVFGMFTSMLDGQLSELEGQLQRARTRRKLQQESVGRLRAATTSGPPRAAAHEPRGAAIPTEAAQPQARAVRPAGAIEAERARQACAAYLAALRDPTVQPGKDDIPGLRGSAHLALLDLGVRAPEVGITKLPPGDARLDREARAQSVEHTIADLDVMLFGFEAQQEDQRAAARAAGPELVGRARELSDQIRRMLVDLDARVYHPQERLTHRYDGLSRHSRRSEYVDPQATERLTRFMDQMGTIEIGIQAMKAVPGIADIQSTFIPTPKLDEGFLQLQRSYLAKVAACLDTYIDAFTE